MESLARPGVVKQRFRGDSIYLLVPWPAAAGINRVVRNLLIHQGVMKMKDGIRCAALSPLRAGCRVDWQAIFKVNRRIYLQKYQTWHISGNSDSKRSN